MNIGRRVWNKTERWEPIFFQGERERERTDGFNKKNITGECLNVWVNRVHLNLSFCEWDRCYFLLLTPHGLERVPATQFAEKLSPSAKDWERDISKVPLG